MFPTLFFETECEKLGANDYNQAPESIVWRMPMLKGIFFDFGNTLISNQVFNLGGGLRAIEKIVEIYNLDEKPSKCLFLAKEA